MSPTTQLRILILAGARITPARRISTMPAFILGHSTTGILTLFEEGGGSLSEDLLALSFSVAGHGLQASVDEVGREVLHIDRVHANDQHNENDGGVEVGCHEGCLQATCCRVENHTPWNQEGCQVGVNTRQGIYSCSTTQQQHGRNNHICHQGKAEESDVSGFAPTC